MNYNEFKKHCEQRNLLVSAIIGHIHMTYQGIKAGLDTGKLGSDKVLAICRLLQISPNAFFGWEPVSYDSDAASAIAALQKQLAVKDQQISELHALLSKK